MPKIINNNNGMLTIETDDGKIINSPMNMFNDKQLAAMTPSPESPAPVVPPSFDPLVAPPAQEPKNEGLLPLFTRSAGNTGIAIGRAIKQAPGAISNIILGEDSDTTKALSVNPNTFEKNNAYIPGPADPNAGAENIDQLNRIMSQVAAPPQVGAAPQPIPQIPTPPSVLPPQAPAQAPVVPGADPMKNIMGSMDSSFKREAAGYDKMAQVGKEIGAAQAAYNQKLEEENQRQAQEREMDAKVFQEKMQADLNSFEQERQNVLNTKITAKNIATIFDDKGAGSKIMGAIGLMIGAVAGGVMGKGGNVALDIINNAIDKDLDSQKSNLQNMQNSLTNRYNGIQLNRTNYLDQQVEKDKIKLLRTEVFKNQLDKTINNLAPQYQNAQLMQLKEGVLQKQIAAKAAYQQSLALRNQQAVQYERAGIKQDDFPGAKDPWQERVVYSAGKTVGSKEAAMAANKIFAEKQSGVQGINDTMDFVNNDYSQFSLADRTRMQSKADMLVGPLKDAIGLGVLSDSDKEFLDGIIGNPNKIFSFSALEKIKLEVIQEKINRDFETSLKAYGVEAPKTQGKYSQGFKPIKGELKK